MAKAMYNENFPHPIEGSVIPLRIGAEMESETRSLEEMWTEMHQRAHAWVDGVNRQIIANSSAAFGSYLKDAPRLGVSCHVPPIIDKSFEQAEIDFDNAKSVEELISAKEKYALLPGKLITYFNNKLKELES